MSINTTKTLGPYLSDNRSNIGVILTEWSNGFAFLLETYFVQDELENTTQLKFKCFLKRIAGSSSSITSIRWQNSGYCTYEVRDNGTAVATGTFYLNNLSSEITTDTYISNEVLTTAIQHEEDGTLKDSTNQLVVVVNVPRAYVNTVAKDAASAYFYVDSVPKILGLAVPTLDAAEYFLGDYAEITITPIKKPIYVEAAILIEDDSIPLSSSRMSIEDTARVITYQLSTNWYYKYFSGSQTRKKITIRVTSYDSLSAIEPLGYNEVSAYVKADTVIYFEVVTCRDDAIHDLAVNKLQGRNKFYFKFYAKPETGYTITSAKIRYDSTKSKDVTASMLNDYYEGTIPDIHSNYIYFDIRYKKDGETGPSAYDTFSSRYPLSLQDWYMPTAHAEITSPLSGDGNITVELTGGYYNGLLVLSNGVDTTQTTIKKIEYKVYDIDHNVILSGEDKPTIDATNGTYSLTKTFHNLDYKQQYQIGFWVYDAVDHRFYAYDQVYVLSEPVFDWNNEDFNFNIPVRCNDGLSANGIYGVGDGREVLTHHNTGDTILGYGNYEAKQGATLIAGNTVDILAHGGFTVNGMTVAENKVLWSGESLMGSGETIYLDGTVSNQANGIVLVFSLYSNGYAENASINSCFKSKKEIELLPGCPHTFLMNVDAGFSIVGSKYLYIYNNRIVGHEGNESTGTNSGITFKNNNYVLRYVIGV